VVYDSLCRELPEGSVRVLSARRNYLDNRDIAGWQEHDAQAPYPIERIELLRPLLLPPPRNLAVSLWRLLAQDLALYVRAYREAARLVARHHINIVVVGELVTGSWLGLALRARFGCRVVIYVHGEEVTTVTGGRLHGNLRAYYLRAADHVVAVSSFTCEALMRLMKVPKEHITLVPNGVDTRRFVPALPSPALVERHQLEGKQVVLTVGRLVTRKGIDMALRAVAQVLRTMPALHYLVAGDGPERARLQQIIDEEGIGSQVTLLGKVSNEDLVRYLQLCDVFLMPNRTLDDGDTEGFGLVFREANACGKPVIGGRAGGVVEAVVDGETGLLVDGTDVNDIAGALRCILGDRELAAHWGAQGLALARANNTGAVADKFLQVCERQLARRPAPALQGS
jgi:glycosyltransferase involved in cell wall biosynthesis